MRTLLALLLVLACGTVLAQKAPKPERGWERIDADEPAPAFTLTDQNGRRVALADFRGKVAFVTFLFTNCTDVCPVLPQMLARVDQDLPENERPMLRYIGISVDPRRDTPRQMKKFMQQRGLSETRWTLLTGSTKELTRVAKDYGVAVRPDAHGDFVHNTVFVLVDAAGRERAEFHGLATPTEELAKAARRLIQSTPSTPGAQGTQSTESTKR